MRSEKDCEPKFNLKIRLTHLKERFGRIVNYKDLLNLINYKGFSLRIENY